MSTLPLAIKSRNAFQDSHSAAQIARALAAKKSGDGWIALCVAHDDSTPSLSITQSEDGRVLFHCHAGCTQAAVGAALKELGLWTSVARPNTQKQARHRQESKITAVYDYTDEDGKILYQVVRKEPGRYGDKKDFFQRYPDPNGAWIWKKHPRQVLYHLPELLDAPIVFVVEGEKDAESLRNQGFIATTRAGGAKAEWLDSFSETLRGRECILIADADKPGRESVSAIAHGLLGIAGKIIVLELDGAKDVTEWLEQGHSELELIELVEGPEASR